MSVCSLSEPGSLFVTVTGTVSTTLFALFGAVGKSVPPVAVPTDTVKGVVVPTEALPDPVDKPKLDVRL